jgi:urease gamma subunit
MRLTEHERERLLITLAADVAARAVRRLGISCAQARA